MKCILLVFALSAVLIMHVECMIMRRCTGECDFSSCPQIDGCPCGTHLDQCRCCSFCSVCRNEACSLYFNDQCEDGYRCEPTEGTTGSDYFLPGVCMKTQ